MMDLADGKRIIVTGNVPDVRPYIQRASVCIAPLLKGAGLRGKVIEYAALRRPFVATSIATTDLVFKDGADYLCADTAAEFIQKAAALLKDSKMAKEMAANAFETAQQNYDTRRLANFLCRLYQYLEKA
jgi:glycosyltransferase involved in cell wall biosynthesis